MNCGLTMLVTTISSSFRLLCCCNGAEGIIDADDNDVASANAGRRQRGELAILAAKGIRAFIVYQWVGAKTNVEVMTS